MLYICICKLTCPLLHLILGEPLHWKELCRIRHLPTRKYLSVVKDQDSYKVTLKAKSTGKLFEEGTTFRLAPVVEDDNDVNYGSYARIYHVHTEQWLHAIKGTYVHFFTCRDCAKTLKLI